MLHTNVPCPFCGLLCDDLVVRSSQSSALKLEKNGCAKAIYHFGQPPVSVSPQINGQKVILDKALTTASQLLKKAKKPLFCGLGTDVDGVRAVLELADKKGGTVDHMYSDAMMCNDLILQETGWILTTLSEIKNRAEMILLVGTDLNRYPRFFERIVWNKHSCSDLKTKQRKIIYVGDKLDVKAGKSPTGKTPTLIPCRENQLAETIGILNGLMLGYSPKTQGNNKRIKVLSQLAEDIKKIRYGTIIWASEEFQLHHSELIVHAIAKLLQTLNQSQRFAGFPIGGNDGAKNANNVCTWQSGYPLRVNFSQGYPEYDPRRYATKRILQNNEADLLCWISSYSTNPLPPKTQIPDIVLAKPETQFKHTPHIFIPVATPGIDHKGQHFRGDSVVSLALKKLRQSNYPSTKDVLSKIISKL